MPWSHRSHALVAGTWQFTISDVHFRKLCRSIVGPPWDIDWNAAWNEILHLGNGRARSFVVNVPVNTWSYITCKHDWNMAKHVANLPAHRWVQYLLSWHPFAVLGEWAVHETPGSQNLMRTADMRILDIAEMRLWTISYGTQILTRLSIFAACK